MTNRRKIPDKLRQIATIRERKARADASRAARRVSDTQEELAAITGEHLRAEAALAADGPLVAGATVQLLALGRQVRDASVAAKATELMTRTGALEQCEDAHRGQLRERHYKEQLYQHWRSVDRGERESGEQRALDDIGRLGTADPVGEQSAGSGSLTGSGSGVAGATASGAGLSREAETAGSGPSVLASDAACDPPAAGPGAE